MINEFEHLFMFIGHLEIFCEVALSFPPIFKLVYISFINRLQEFFMYAGYDA